MYRGADCRFDWVAGGFHDPFVGSGSTVAAAARHGITATGADLADRFGGRFPVRDFFTDTTCYSNLVTNPPFVRAAEAIEYGLDHLRDGGRIAILADLNFLSALVGHMNVDEELLAGDRVAE